ncbi:phage tail protein [Pseudomonas frederiksbergensis]|uniref:Phage tail protein n=1 Tax=Pseudomonas frederiksbergensis TaxID=104087 RepID=A0A1J0EKM2_9PSED|nr:tail fiber protein [Pseudomonas frederiksbergensis]APC16617.1 phage tail protein [Pseudomonas frederiksbergensis]
MEVFTGTIQSFAFDYPPSGWALCNGQTLQVNQFQALFALLGTKYGGNGSTNFMLPDLQGRLPLCQGSGLNLTPRVIGTSHGGEKTTVAVSNLPVHQPTATATATNALTATTTVNLAGVATTAANAPSATNSFIGASPASGPTSADIYTNAIGSTPVPMQGVSTAVGGTVNVAVAVAPIGGGVPVDTMNPFLVLNFSICLNGLYPTRN